MTEANRTKENQSIERWALMPGNELTTSALIRHTGEWVRYEDHLRVIDRLLKALRYMDHTPNDCSITEWRDSVDHFRTSFGAPIVGPECTCGMIKEALAIEREFYGDRAIPQQHYEELGV